MSSTVRIEYQYRDADNYKSWNELFFSNPRNLTIESIERNIKKTLIDEMWFVADQVQIPELFPFRKHQATVADHCLHELVSVTNHFDVDKPKEIEMSIEDLVARFENAFAEGWRLFNPTI